ncbi:hypothetical protein [Roseomonas sp. 18066]|uniref:hypothetical protein n=1 Tax=Roseomonas sp. 18066 TaxID=2681412 RepID=UPI00135ADB25|nr:hypothetical protein [Roseomonas sp. 18066]
MANASVLRSPPTEAGAYSGGAWRPPLPLPNLTSQDPERVARTVDVNLASTQFRVDCGRPSLISQFALINYNMTTAGLLRLVLTDSPTIRPDRHQSHPTSGRWQGVDLLISFAIDEMNGLEGASL